MAEESKMKLVANSNEVNGFIKECIENQGQKK